MNDLFISQKYASLIGDIYALSSAKGIKEIFVNPEKVPALPEGDPFGAIAQLTEYFNGQRKKFDVPFDIDVTQFTKTVLDKIYEIPFGKTMTYSGLAAAIGKPNAARAVGGALGRNPVLIMLPCHRIVGKTSLGGFAAGLPVKIKLLEMEGVLL